MSSPSPKRNYQLCLGSALVLLVLSCLASMERPALADEQGLPVGAAMEDFGLREVNLQTGQLQRIVWLSEQLQRAGAAAARKLLVLNFFASWCQPCRHEMQALSELQRRYGADGLQVVSVGFRRSGEDADAELKATAAALSGMALGFPLLFDRYTTRAQGVYLGSRAVLPANIFIDGSGRIARRLQGKRAASAAELEAEIRAALQLPAAGAGP